MIDKFYFFNIFIHCKEINLQQVKISDTSEKFSYD